jgi:2-polyprenyl-3-methyl-5-hydroxy-6-metoxy-1,4-benzoquinol methylase
MPFDATDFRHRAELTELTEKIDEPCSRDELRACLRDLQRLNRWFLAYRPVLHWLNSISTTPAVQPLHIVDVGCGYGDTLRRVERWARTRGIPVELTGLDLNPDAVAIAAEASLPGSVIHWVAANVFEWQPEKPIHFVVSSLFTHHLTEPDVIRFLQWMEFHAEFGWFINDLSRAAIPYHLLRMFTKLARLHPFVQHDGPVSIARSFIPEDWQRMCAAAGLNTTLDASIDLRTVSIQPSWPARLCVSRRKTP